MEERAKNCKGREVGAHLEKLFTLCGLKRSKQNQHSAWLGLHEFCRPGSAPSTEAKAAEPPGAWEGRWQQRWLRNGVARRRPRRSEMTETVSRKNEVVVTCQNWDFFNHFFKFFSFF